MKMMSAKSPVPIPWFSSHPSHISTSPSSTTSWKVYQHARGVNAWNLCLSSRNTSLASPHARHDHERRFLPSGSSSCAQQWTRTRWTCSESSTGFPRQQRHWLVLSGHSQPWKGDPGGLRRSTDQLLLIEKRSCEVFEQRSLTSHEMRVHFPWRLWTWWSFESAGKVDSGENTVGVFESAFSPTLQKKKNASSLQQESRRKCVCLPLDQRRQLTRWIWQLLLVQPSVTMTWWACIWWRVISARCVLADATPWLHCVALATGRSLQKVAVCLLAR